MVSVALPDAKPYVTDAILRITVVVYVLQILSTIFFGYAGSVSRPAWNEIVSAVMYGSTQQDWLEFYGSQLRNAILMGQVWRFMTPLFLHVSFFHIFFNMWALNVFGKGLERMFGHWRFLLLYLLAGFSGNVFYFLLTGGPSVGASTAIFGLVAAEGVFLYQNRRLFGKGFRSAITNIIVVVVGNLALGQILPGIDNWGHIGGLLGGLIFAWFAGPLWELTGTLDLPQLRDQRELRNVVTGAAAVIVLFGGLALWGMLTLSANG